VPGFESFILEHSYWAIIAL